MSTGNLYNFYTSQSFYLPIIIMIQNLLILLQVGSPSGLEIFKLLSCISVIHLSQSPQTVFDMTSTCIKTQGRIQNNI